MTPMDPRTLHDLPTPALVVDLDRLETNLDRMAARCRALGVALRPHAKTHKCVEIARLQAARGARGLTVSTLHEARVFADHGFDDLSWAFPVPLGRVAEARELAERVTLHLVVDSAAAVEALEAGGFPFHVWLEVDTGQHRSGVDPDGSAAVELARRLAGHPTLRFDGLLTHGGHAYRGPGEAPAAARQERDLVAGLADRLRGAGVEVPALSVGSTPGLAAVDRLDGIDEVRPGNYAFYDGTQVWLGSCTAADCAATVVATVVSSQPGAGRSVVDAGALALSKDPGPPGCGHWGATFAGLTSRAGDRLDPGARLTSLSQEHGVLAAERPVGSRVRILPHHSCLAVACFDHLWAVRGERVVDRWRVWRGREMEAG
jgi:D-serine deaminase-like pyridoxal phosphate-dependent protein